jgi:transglutaminase-like putative cysteine protease
MKFYTVAIPVLLFISSTIKAQINYSIQSIPKALMSRAGAIVRNSETTITIRQLDEVYIKERYAITILNASAMEEASLYLFYDDDSSIRSVKGVIYNEFGLPDAKIVEKNFQDRSAVSDFSLYEDNRVKIFRPARTSYPFTIEYEYEVKRKQSMHFPTWIPSRSPGVAVQNSSLTFICPQEFNLRYHQTNYSAEVKQHTAEGLKNYTWRVENLNALRSEPFSPNHESFLTTVKLALDQFAYRKIKGSFSNWQEFGTWTSNNLLKERDQLSESTRQIILDLVKDDQNPKTKAQKIYEYMQRRTRYISVQIGIGGFRPYPASEVDRLGYGDCKGLVNYMRALLKVAGIESYYSIVYAGDSKKDIMPNFTSMQGNHAILCIPFAKDTTWLECTSKFAPFGFLGSFTDDRYVLACTPEGGKILRTPKLNAIDNKQVRTASFKIDESGLLSGKLNTIFTGSQYDNHQVLLNEAFAEQIKKLPELYPLPNLQVKSAEFKQVSGAAPETRETVQFDSYQYASTSNNQLTFRINSINAQHPIKEVSNRNNPVLLNRGYYDEDTYSFELPSNFVIPPPPKPILLESPFGRYSADIKINGSTLVYHRTMLLNDGVFPKESYQDLVDFFLQITDADDMKVTLEKKR